jgi:hypothetical protein
VSAQASAAAPAGLPELAAVHWRRRIDEPALTRSGRRWTLCTAAHTVPLVATAAVLAALNPLTIPVGLILLAHAWAIPELYAARGAKVIRRRDTEGSEAEKVAVGLLGDLLDHPARNFLLASGMVLEKAGLGVWLLAPDGALLVPPGGRRVYCYCVGVSDRGLPPSDRTAHLLLALREDESGLATVANLAFAGAPWRLRRRLKGPARAGLDEAARLARGLG